MSEKKDNADLLAQAKADYKLALEAFDHNRKLWLEAAKFRAGEQWPDAIKKKREAEGLPCLVVDKLNQYVHQVVNDGRQNRPAVKVRPVDDGADVEVAEGIQGLIRGICSRSNADESFDTALDHAAGNGFGYFRVITEYAHERTFNQEIAVRRVRNPLAVLLSPHQLADGSDARFGFFIEEVPKKEYKKRYPKAKETNWEAEGFAEGWTQGDNVLVCEYFYKVEEPGLLHLLADGTSCPDDEYQRAIAEGVEPPEIMESREIPLTKVKWCRLSGAEILEENKWLGKFVPIIPVYGNESDIEGKVTYTGLIHAAKDPQILHNVSRSAFAQRVTMTPKAPWLAAAEQIADYPEWDDPQGNHGVLRYKHMAEDGTVIPPPQRISPTDVPAGFIEDMQASEHDIQGALGMYAASLGEKSNEKSGKAIMARQREGDTATFHYQDNLNRAIRYLGRILVDLAPKIYDSQRVIRLLGEDGEAKMAEVNPAQEQAVVKQGSKVIYNLNIGLYDVDVAAGPSYTTKRQESAEAMIQLTQANPTMWQTHGDLIVGAQDWPNADAFAKRSKLLLPPNIQQAEAEEDNSQDPMLKAQNEALQQQIQMAEQGIQERDQALQQVTQQLEAEKAKNDADLAKAQVEQYKAETERLQLAQPQPQPEDTSGIELAKIEAEKWKAQLDADTKVIVEAIKQQGATQTASIGAQAQAADREAQAMQQTAEPAVEAPAVDTNAAIIAALQSFTEAVSRPRVATLSDGRQIRVQ